MPAASADVDIINMALGLAGQRQFLDNALGLAENSTQAQVAAVFFEPIKQRLLSSFAWRFATKRAVLALSTETRSGWAYAYTCPADCLVARGIWPGKRAPGYGEAIPFAKELAASGNSHLILTDMVQAELSYTVNVMPAGLMPPHFVEAFAAALSVPFAAALGVKPQLMPMLQQGALNALMTAKAVDAMEGRLDDEADSEVTRVR